MINFQFKKNQYVFTYLQEGLEDSSTLLDQPSRPQSHNALADMLERMSISDSQMMGLSNGGTGTMGSLFSGASSPTLARLPGTDSINSHSFASVGASLSRYSTPEAQVVGRSPSDGYLSVDAGVLPTRRNNAIGSSFQNGRSLSMARLDDIAGSQSGGLSKVRNASETSLLQSQLHMGSGSQLRFSSNNHGLQQVIDEASSSRFAGSSKVTDSRDFETSALGYSNFPRRTASSANFYSKRNSLGSENLEGLEDHYLQGEGIPNIDFLGHIHAGYLSNRQLNSALNGNYDTG